jgi:hypothetical protein
MLTTTRISLLVLVAALAIGAPSVVFAQQSGQTQQQASSAEGELVEVNVNAKVITVKPASGPNLQFSFNDETKVTGARDVAGLATMSGSRVKVTYGANRMATEIAIQPRA